MRRPIYFFMKFAGLHVFLVFGVMSVTDINYTLIFVIFAPPALLLTETLHTLIETITTDTHNQ